MDAEVGVGFGHLGLNARMIYQCARVCRESAHGAADVGVDLHDLLDAAGLLRAAAARRVPGDRKGWCRQVEGGVRDEGMP